MMKRRDFLTLLGSAAWPLAARAQQQKFPIVGVLRGGSRDDSAIPAKGLREGLRQTGFIEGQNVAIEYLYAENQPQLRQALAGELVHRQVDVIVASPGPGVISAVMRATTTIPIVFMSGADPVRNGLVASLNRPGGNLTGVTLLGQELTTKRLGLLHDSVSDAATIAILLDSRPAINIAEFQLQEAETAARKVGLQMFGARVSAEAEVDTAVATAVRAGAGALLVSASGFFVDIRERLVAHIARHKLPAIYQTREYTDAGGLMSYGPSLTDAYRQVGAYTGRILKGEKPADLPVMLPTKFEFVINLKTAKALDLAIPAGILAIADEVIE
jgi:putative tryptophan/tyrosine transport system substrate-binding protein